MVPMEIVQSILLAPPLRKKRHGECRGVEIFLCACYFRVKTTSFTHGKLDTSAASFTMTAMKATLSYRLFTSLKW